MAFPTAPEAKAEGDAADKKPRKFQVAELVELVTASGAELFRTPEKKPYLTATVDGHEETYRLESRDAKGWLRRLYRTEFGRSVSRHALHDLEGTALYDCEVYEVHVRQAEHLGGEPGRTSSSGSRGQAASGGGLPLPTGQARGPASRRPRAGQGHAAEGAGDVRRTERKMIVSWS